MIDRAQLTTQQLKAILTAIIKYNSLSGLSFDDKHGANVQTPSEIVVWDEYVKKRPLVSQFIYTILIGSSSYSATDKAIPE